MLRQSSLAIVDLTGGRPSVYYEAGLAHGLGMPVIFTCAREIKHWRLAWDPRSAKRPAVTAFDGWDQALAFDIRQYPCVDWGSAEELKKKLVDRIYGRGFEAKRRSAPTD